MHLHQALEIVTFLVGGGMACEDSTGGNGTTDTRYGLDSKVSR